MIETKTPHLTLIDGLRGLSAFSVLVYHYVHFFMTGPERLKPSDFPALAPFPDALSVFYSDGSYAVHVFWMISGFIFTYVYPGQIKSFRDFAVNRFARLYPLHFVTLMVVTVLFFVAQARLGYTPIFKNFDLLHFVAQLGLASNWIKTSYSFNGPIWSVSAEILIYGVFWLVGSRLAQQNVLVPALLAAGFFLLSLELRSVSPVFECGMFFFSGAACARACLDVSSKVSTFLLGLLLIAQGMAISIWLGRDCFLLVGGTLIFGGLLMILYTLENMAFQRIRRIAKWVGDTSFGLYLWHFPIQLVLILIFLPSGKLETLARMPAFLIFYLVLTLIVARLSYIYLEAPARRFVRGQFAEKLRQRFAFLG